MQSKRLNELIEDIKRRKYVSSHLVASKIITFFLELIRNVQFDNPGKLIAKVKEMGKQLAEADNMNFVVPNTVKRILHQIREACNELKLNKFLQAEECDSPQKFKGMEDFGKARSKFKKISFDDSQLIEADSPEIVSPLDMNEQDLN